MMDHVWVIAWHINESEYYFVDFDVRIDMVPPPYLSRTRIMRAWCSSVNFAKTFSSQERALHWLTDNLDGNRQFKVLEHWVIA